MGAVCKTHAGDGIAPGPLRLLTKNQPETRAVEFQTLGSKGGPYW